MPTLSKISYEARDFLRLDGLSWFAEAANHTGLTRGGIYLLSGQPSAGKSTLALQMGVDLACRGYKVLYLALELTPPMLKQWVEQRIFPHRHNASYEERRKKLPWKDGLKKTREALLTVA